MKNKKLAAIIDIGLRAVFTLIGALVGTKLAEILLSHV